MIRNRVAFAICLGLHLTACGGSSKGSDTDNKTVGGLPGDTQLKDVSQKQLVTLCESQHDRLEALVAPCAGTGFDQKTKAACEAAHAACLEDDSEPVDAIDCDGADIADLKGCTVTVGEFDACLSEVAKTASKLSCDNFGNQPAVPACFESISAKCKNLFD